MKCPEQVNTQSQKTVWWLSGLGDSRLGVSGVSANGNGASVFGDEVLK